MSDPNTEYSEAFKVYRHDGDYRGRLKPAALLRYAQQVAMQNAWNVGLTDEVYNATHTAYVLAKMAVHIDELPRVDSTVTLLTQPEAAKRATNKRVTRVFDETGAQAALIDSRWVVIDTQKRAILRTHPPQFEGPWADKVDAELPMQMQKPPLASCEDLGTRMALYSICDMNGHMNNTRYLDIIFDALPWEELDGCAAQDLLIFYHKEIPRGQSFTLYRRKTAPHSWYFNGQRDGHSCFEATLTLTPDP